MEEEKGRRVKIILVVALVAVITFFLYSTELRDHLHHIFYQGLYFIPVILAGFWFGLRGALATSLSITLLCIPFTFIYWKGFTTGDFNNVMEMVLYNVLALVLGTLRERERVHQKRLRETERLTAMGQAVSALAHDMRTPLIAIAGLSRLVQKQVCEDSLSCEKLKIIMKEAQRLDSMVKEMLDFSRPLELHASEANIDEILSQCLEITREVAQEKQVKVRINFTLNSPFLFLDALRIKQAFINLLTNAIEASPEGETVTVSSYRKGGELIIDVSDRGCGISHDRREQVFSPFFTTKNGGTGLGLPITKKIVEAHQGRLEVFDNTEKGVTFRVVIPMPIAMDR
jgi:signal transduction histidine kinase